jgi:NAD(P)-dependent dehydrogenase (short-subunit alcohol dehydrogenase family)
MQAQNRAAATLDRQTLLAACAGSVESMRQPTSNAMGQPMDFSDKVVVVTGAGSGIGRAVAIGFCAEGARVLGIGRTKEALEETNRLCAGRMDFVTGDVTRAEDVEALIGTAMRKHGKVDVLVNNAAVYPRTAFLDSSHEDWSDAISTNVVGMALCCRQVLPGMLERGFGRIINLGSFAWKRPIPNSSAYSVSKGAVVALTKALAVEIDRERYPDVLINELVPGAVRTRMSESGEDPKDIFAHVRFVASLPRNGPTGRTFVQSTLHTEDPGLRGRLKRVVSRLFHHGG